MKLFAKFRARLGRRDHLLNQQARKVPTRDVDRIQFDDTFYVDDATDPAFGFSIGPQYLRTHPPEVCFNDEACVIHNPSAHHMREWPLTYRGDSGDMERTCPHGVGHPDPDHLAWAKAVFPGYVGVHGCCHEQCCIPPNPQ